MKVYHGSNSYFRHLRISKSLVKHNSSLLNEGLGIYFTTDKEVARSYGKYIYILEINDKYFKDFRSRTTCRLLIAKLAKLIYKKYGVDILKYVNLQELSEKLYLGGIAFYSLDKEITQVLESTEEWYFGVNKTKREAIYRDIRKYMTEELIVYMFNYHIKDIGIIRSTDDNVVKIIGKENSY